MKNLLATIVTAAFATLLFNAALTLTQDHRTVWQYDHWRAVYRAEQERQARAVWLAAEFARTNVVSEQPQLFYATNGVLNFVTLGSLCITNSYWGGSITLQGGLFNPTRSSAESLPQFSPGDLELGYRRDGTVVFRKPPELEPKLTLREAAEAGKRKVLDAVTNL